MIQFEKYSVDVDKNLDLIKADNTFYEHVGNWEIANLDQIIPPQDLMQLKNAIFAIDPGMPGLTCFRIRTSKGILDWIAANVWKKGEYGELISMELSDIQTLKTDVNSRQFDEMTGVLNKQTIRDLAHELTVSKTDTPFYVCLLDIDYFKSVNDTFGHACGDDVIIDVAHIIKGCVGDYGKVGRIGGDEFMLVLDKVSQKPHLREMLSSIRETVENKYRRFKDAIDITVSIGAALYPTYAVDFDNLFELTDKMLYLAKSKGRNRYIVYTPEIHGDMNGIVKVENVTAVDSGDDEDKLRLMLEMFEDFLVNATSKVRDTMELILRAYDLDEVVIFTDDLEKSSFCVKRVSKGAGAYDIVDDTMSMPFLATESFQKRINVNNVAFINVFDLSKDSGAEIKEYMEHQGYHHLLVYQFNKNGNTCYVVFISARENSRRQSMVESNDLIYFARMFELRKD